MIDIATQLKTVYREVKKRQVTGGDEGETVSILLRRRYTSPIDDVWDAVTEPDRLARWFAPVSGDLQAGGKFQVEGNAGGEILRCERPQLLQLTWGAENSIVELRLAADENDDTVIELEHTVPIEIAGSGAGSLYVGPGWDVSLLGLDRYVRGEADGDPTEWENSDDVQRFSQHSVSAWASATEASGTATTEEVAEARKVALAQFAPDLTT
ncbi:ATPase [Prauserella sp. PE36]|uniref:SRPBCC family protein n=1 Tax=Prauserella endophytica TaxID=1592324 RepID=A0ABY2S486_9PSEU|nr:MULTISPECIES: SRPBCC family protein [Prauserella]PXY23481.1 ATPase [Prauserella coralliicola]RBM18325.1 ATPase [Prauserella sp. PE36]TKG70532.1 SRPBCC family protein [Prauserella endophytica]